LAGRGKIRGVFGQGPWKAAVFDVGEKHVDDFLAVQGLPCPAEEVWLAELDLLAVLGCYQDVAGVVFGVLVVRVILVGYFSA
jgi:hypothetical protein